MYWLVHKGLKYLQFPALADIPQIFHGVFLRDMHNHCGPSTSFNIGLGCGESETRVWENRQRMLSIWSHPTGVFARQIHGAEVGVWSASNGHPILDNAVQLEGDALITDQPEGALVIQTADCQSVILVDPVRRVVANVHSGWRGSIQNIIGRTIEAMAVQFSSRPADLIAGIGPSLGPCCAEFVNYRQEIPEELWVYRGSGNRFNFWQMSVDQLSRAGLHLNNISVAGICTRCNPHLFFSYRTEKQTGRFATVVGIRKNA